MVEYIWETNIFRKCNGCPGGIHGPSDSTGWEWQSVGTSLLYQNNNNNKNKNKNNNKNDA